MNISDIRSIRKVRALDLYYINRRVDVSYLARKVPLCDSASHLGTPDRCVVRSAYGRARSLAGQDVNEVKKSRRQWQHAGHFNVALEQDVVKCKMAAPIAAVVWMIEFSGFYTTPGEMEKVGASCSLRFRGRSTHRMQLPVQCYTD